MHPKIKSRSRTFAVAAGLVAAMAGTATEAQACSGDAPILGSVCTFAFNFCPRGFAPANGALMSIAQNTALFSLLGTYYGGNGQTTFALPNLQGRVAVGTGQGPASTVILGQQRGAESTTLSSSQVPLAAHTHPATFGGAGTMASGSVNLPFSTQANLPVSGTTQLKALSSRSASSNTPGAGSVLGNTGTARIYAGTGGDMQLGSDIQITATATGTVSGTASGTVSLPISGGGVSVQANTAVPASQAVSLLDPGLGMTVCIATEGIYPSQN